MIRIPTKEDLLRLKKRNAEILKILKEEAKKELKNKHVTPAREDLLKDLLKKDRLIGLDRWMPSEKAIRRLRDLGLIEGSAIFPEEDPDYLPPRWLRGEIKQRLIRKGDILRTSSYVEEYDPDIIEDLVPALKEHENVFYKEGDSWFIKFNQIWKTLVDKERLRYIIYLLERPNTRVHCSALIQHVKKIILQDDEDYKKIIQKELKEGNINLLSSTDIDIDQEDQQRIIEFINEYTENLKEARLGGNKKNIINAENDWMDIQEYYRNEYNLKIFLGSDYKIYYRKFKKYGPEIEKDRQNVKNQINKACKDIGSPEKIPALKDHLSKFVNKGLYCTYSPDPLIDWYIVW